MGLLHSMAEIFGLKQLFAPVFTAVIGDGELMHRLVLHGWSAAAVVMAQLVGQTQEQSFLQQRSRTVRGNSSASSPRSLRAG